LKQRRKPISFGNLEDTSKSTTFRKETFNVSKAPYYHLDKTSISYDSPETNAVFDSSANKNKSFLSSNRNNNSLSLAEPASLGSKAIQHTKMAEIIQAETGQIANKEMNKVDQTKELRSTLQIKKRKKIVRHKSQVFNCNHTNEEHYAKGLCKACYQHEYFIQSTKPKDSCKRKLEKI
jgi:hypothetical protein